MARVTVEDCVDKVPNRFELILLATHRAWALTKGAPITVDPENDKYPVIALREIAEKTVSPADMREGLIASIQLNVEVDEPELTTAPLVPRSPPPMLGRDDPSNDNLGDTITEEALLRGMQTLSPQEAPKGDAPPSGSSGREY